MAVYNYKKFKISLRSDSSKVQGLQTGDIVRRQYHDGTQLVYTLMCVLDYGEDEVVNATTQEVNNAPYFIGALLDGDEPHNDELLDFVRVTNLFDLNRSGALYLTANDQESPYMDVIDGIAQNRSLCWPTGIASSDFQDPHAQYVVTAFDSEYIKFQDQVSRICHLTYSNPTTGFKGLSQEFYDYVSASERILISFRAKSSGSCNATVSLSYGTGDGLREDGSVTVRFESSWKYYFIAIGVANSGRHIRRAAMDLAVSTGTEVWIGDFNIIRLSSIAQFGDSSKVRVGKLDGIVDPVFGKIHGYGGYLQQLYASQAAHVSGTLTAGDDNGFGATFYAGKIHRNVFINSLSPLCNGFEVFDQGNPTGVGGVYGVSGTAYWYKPQTNEWLHNHVGEQYCLSFWAKWPYSGNVVIRQNSRVIGTLSVADDDALSWIRWTLSFDLLPGLAEHDDLSFEIVPMFNLPAGTSAMEAVYFWSAPQLEKGYAASQYQPTDDHLSETEDYGAWFSRGGIGGTIQNPLLKLNYDGNGGIGTRSDSLSLHQDGSGHLAQGNISWNSEGHVQFGDKVTLNWDNIGDDARTELQAASVRILGQDTFIVAGNELSGTPIEHTPSYIDLTIEEQNLLNVQSRQWWWDNGGTWQRLPGGNGKSCRVLPTESYWRGLATLTIKCVVTTQQTEYSDTVTLKKHMASRYEVKVTSESGETFKNGVCSTTLTAKVYYQGLQLPDDYVNQHFTFNWVKYSLPDTDIPVEGWWEERTDEDGLVVQPAIDRNAPSITLNYGIENQDLYVCELQGTMGFPYVFPFILS